MRTNSFAEKKHEAEQKGGPKLGLLSRAEVAEILGVCPHTVQRLTRKGELPALVFNRRLIRYSPEVVERYVQSANTQLPA